MRGAWRWALSLAYVVQAYAMMALMALWFVPLTVADRRWALIAVQSWCRYARRSARWMVGIETEVRGQVPAGEAIVAAKHQSFLDIIVIVSELPRPRFVMKAELTRAPILGWFALRMGCVPVERGRRQEAVARMLADVEAGRAEPGQLVIYPQGTRVAPGERLPYKAGTAALYEAMGAPCVPAACNVGLFWPRRGVMRRPGLAVVEFLDPIAPGLPGGQVLSRIEREVEAASDRLMAEARRPPRVAEGAPDAPERP